MPHIKSVSGYRRPSLAYVASDEEVARKRKAYLTWLARRMGLTTDTVPDTGRAEEYVRAQEAELDARASQAVEGLKHRLFWRGLRPVVISYGVPHPKTLDEYDARERADDLNSYTIESLWYVPGTTKIVHVGTNGCGTRRGFRDVPKPTVSIIITPGRAPSSYELDRLIDEALAQLTEPQLIAA